MASCSSRATRWASTPPWSAPSCSSASQPQSGSPWPASRRAASPTPRPCAARAATPALAPSAGPSRRSGAETAVASRLMRRALRGLSSVLIVTGVLLVLDAVLTVVWQEPVTAIYGKVRQGQLGGDLDKLNRTPLTPSERGVLKVLHSDDQRVAFLARSMR